MNKTTNSIKINKPSSAALGAVTGFLNGLLGSGGGTVAVFGMQRYLGIETHKSHATAIAIILPLSIMSLFVYGGKGAPDIKLLFFVSLGGVFGGFTGARLLEKIKPANLHKAFGTIMIITAIKMFY